MGKAVFTWIKEGVEGDEVFWRTMTKKRSAKKAQNTSHPSLEYLLFAALLRRSNDLRLIENLPFLFLHQTNKNLPRNLHCVGFWVKGCRNLAVGAPGRVHKLLSDHYHRPIGHVTLFTILFCFLSVSMFKNEFREKFPANNTNFLFSEE